MSFPVRTIRIVAFGACLAAASEAHAGSTFHFNASQSYSSVADSPFASLAGNGLKIETFEDGLFNTPRVRTNGGFVQGPSSSTDSVDGDDGLFNGTGQQGHSYNSGTSTQLTFRFIQNASQQMPSMAGLVWTDGNPNSTVTLRAWDAFGVLLGKVTVNLGDLVRNGTTADDRFLGVTSDTGISKIRIISNFAGFEVDHLQFAYGFAVVPIPPALALGAVGLAGVIVLRRRSMKRLAK